MVLKEPASSPPAYFEGLPQKLTALLKQESDRGVILILAAYLEELLGHLIEASCTSKSAAKKLLDYRQPAGSFSAKIELCRAFGLLSVDEVQRLDLVRRIRHPAAHFDGHGHGFDVLFDSRPTAQQVAALARDPGLDIGDRTLVRGTFIAVARSLALLVLMRITMAERPVAPESPTEALDELRGTALGDLLDRARSDDSLLSRLLPTMLRLIPRVKTGEVTAEAARAKLLDLLHDDGPEDSEKPSGATVDAEAAAAWAESAILVMGDVTAPDCNDE